MHPAIPTVTTNTSINSNDSKQMTIIATSVITCKTPDIMKTHKQPQ